MLKVSSVGSINVLSIQTAAEEVSLLFLSFLSVDSLECSSQENVEEDIALAVVIKEAA